MIVSQNGSEILTIPTQINKINVNSMEVVKVKEEMAEINMGYTYKIAGKETQVERNFRIEIERKENEVASCISRGTLGLDPKEACDLVVGYNEEGSSYYENGRCRFAKASCEQSGRV